MGVSRRSYAAQRGVTEATERNVNLTRRISTPGDRTIDQAKANADWGRPSHFRQTSRPPCLQGGRASGGHIAAGGYSGRGAWRSGNVTLGRAVRQLRMQVFNQSKHVPRLIFEGRGP